MILEEKIGCISMMPGKVMAAQVKPGNVNRLQGSDIAITVDNGKVKVNDANVIQTDIETSNGALCDWSAQINVPRRQRQNNFLFSRST